MYRRLYFAFEHAARPLHLLVALYRANGFGLGFVSTPDCPAHLGPGEDAETQVQPEWTAMRDGGCHA